MKRVSLVSLTVLSVAGCTGDGAKSTLEFTGPSPRAISALQTVNERAQACWIKSGDKDFKGLAIIPEIDTRIGKPRLLVVEKGKATGLPRLVIEATGDPVRINSYGPLAATPVATRVNQDVSAWSAGRTTC